MNFQSELMLIGPIVAVMLALIAWAVLPGKRR